MEVVPSAAAHPRSRGENFEGGLAVLGGERLIPAHAGKTTREVTEPARRRAHPRSRGENVLQCRRTSRLQGSSPLTRGKRREVRRCVPASRLIPAHAGKTFQAELEMIRDRAHPRSRGENRSMAVAFSASSGSSPLTRGKRHMTFDARRDQGLIPAHAGKTWRRSRGSDTGGAHPRSRGENTACSAGRASVMGSSPLTRGKPW